MSLFDVIKKVFSKFEIPLTRIIKPEPSAIESFYKEVISDPFACRANPKIRFQYEILKKLKPLTLKDSERSLIKELAPSLDIFINETPHLFANSIESNCLFFKPPAHVLLNQKDYKFGDLISLENDYRAVNAIVECKTFERLTRSKSIEICKQYSYCQNIKEINFSIIYNRSEISLAQFKDILYTNIMVEPHKISFLSAEELRDLSKNYNFEKFFNFYKEISYNEYDCFFNKITNLLIDEAKIKTNDPNIKTALERFRKKIEKNITGGGEFNKSVLSKKLSVRKKEEEDNNQLVENNNFDGGE